MIIEQKRSSLYSPHSKGPSKWTSRIVMKEVNKILNTTDLDTGYCKEVLMHAAYFKN